MSDSSPSMQVVTLSVEELKALIHDAVREALAEYLGEDFHSEPRFAPEVAARLEQYKTHPPVTHELSEVELYGDLSDFPVDDFGPFPDNLALRREDMYGDSGR